MQRLVYSGPGDLRWEDAAAPQLEDDVGALVRPLAVATCDLDDLIIAGGSPFPAPFAIGHECVAEVIDVGDGVRSFRPGDRVVVPFQISCGRCAACRRGHTSNCLTVARSSTYGFGPQVDVWGGFFADLASRSPITCLSRYRTNSPRPRSPALRTTSPTPGAPSLRDWPASLAPR